MVEQESHEDSVDNSISVTRQKIIFVGDAATGKTSIINRIIDNPFNDIYEVSIGIDFMSKNIRFRGQNTKIQIWDSAGQEKYKGLIPSYIRNSSIVFLVYDVSKRSSFDNIMNWINFVRNIEKTIMVLCGNKIDLNREVEKNEGEELARKEGLLFFECSAKTNENIKLMFYSAIAGLPSFGVTDESEKENMIKELMEENGGEGFRQGGVNQDLVNKPDAKINVNGEISDSNQKDELASKNIANLKTQINEKILLLKKKDKDIINLQISIKNKDIIIKEKLLKIKSLEEEKTNYLKENNEIKQRYELILKKLEDKLNINSAEEMIFEYEKKILLLKQQLKKNYEDEMTKKIEVIKHQYEENIFQLLNNIEKNLIKIAEIKLKDLKDKYNNIYSTKEVELNQKCNDITKINRNKIGRAHV